MNVALYEGCVLDVAGFPSIFFSDRDFNQILSNRVMQKDLIQVYGEGVCIGLLGEETPEGFVDRCVGIDVRINDEQGGDLGFYEKL